MNSIHYLSKESQDEILYQFLEIKPTDYLNKLKQKNFTIFIQNKKNQKLNNLSAQNFEIIKSDFKKNYKNSTMHDLKSFNPEIFEEIYFYLENAKKKSKFDITFKEKHHLYPFDTLLFFNNMNIPECLLKKIAIANTFFYMISHITDDYFDNPNENFSNFLSNVSEDVSIKQIIDIVTRAFFDFTIENFSKKSAIRLSGIFKRKYFDLILQFKEMIDFYDTYNIPKNHIEYLIQFKGQNLSGLMYSFLSDIILETTDICKSLTDYDNLFEINKSIGLLCQLSDDLRDFREDYKTIKSNIYIQILKNHYIQGSDRANEYFMNLIYDEINKISEKTKKVDILLEKEDIMLLISYPLFLI
ncbi:MAG: class 1 isoprenoid biosynthesis enzyme [Theionarchaea archaeon]|nr:class 1 isoprenoid biosynthesis enzyme [Theionarchaea archaeon]